MAKPSAPKASSSLSTGWSLLLDLDVMQILVQAVVLLERCDANATATALPIPEELPARQQVTIVATRGSDQVRPRTSLAKNESCARCTSCPRSVLG